MTSERRRYHLVLMVLVLLARCVVSAVAADECSDFVCANIEDDDERAACVDQKINCYQKKLDANKNEQQTLSGELT